MKSKNKNINQSWRWPKVLFGLMGVCVFVALSFLGVQTALRTPKISVVMSTYNREEFLPRAIDSVLNQTEKDFEFIIVNDGSTDKTSAILNEYALKDRRIVVLDNEQNKGLVFSLNRGLDAARGKYIARMDDDDISLPTRFEKQWNFMENQPELTVTGAWISSAFNLTPTSFQRGTDPQKNAIDVYLGNVPIAHPSAFMRRGFIQKHKIRYNPTYKAAEDRKFWLDLLDAGGKIGNVPEVLVQMRIHISNSSEYYEEQARNTVRFRNEVRSKFLTQDDLGLPDCMQLNKIAEWNKKIKRFDVTKMEELFLQKCPSYKGNAVKHATWSDTFVFNEENRVCREDLPEQCATVLFKTPNELVIKWDQWGFEIFIKNRENIWILKK